MRKFLTIVFAISMLLFAFIPTVAYAWESTYQIYCYFDKNAFPAGTSKVDLLLPITQNDELYTEYNAEQGERHGISSDSQIVKYNEDGYMSYTFHYKNAESKIIPITNYRFYVSDEDPELRVLASAELSEYLEHSSTDRDYYHISIEYSSDEFARIDSIFGNTLLVEQSSIDDIFVIFNSVDNYSNLDLNSDRLAKLFKEYKTAKIAYIDDSGNVLGVSDKVRIRTPLFNRDYDVSLTVNANKQLDCSTTSAPSGFLVIILALPMILIRLTIPISVILLPILLLIRMKIKHKKRKQ